MSIQRFYYEKSVDFEQLDCLFVSLAPDVFRFFHQDIQQTIETVEHSDSADFCEEYWGRRRCLKNDPICIEIFQEARFYDNSMTARWVYGIALSIQCSANAPPILRLFEEASASSTSTCQLTCESNPEYQAFVDFYLDRLSAAIEQLHKTDDR
jgi:hypothetical protein